MILINLLPHRELKKAAHRKRFQNMLAAALLAGLGLSYAGYSWLDSTLSEQQRRNQQLQTAIAKLDKELSNIETLRRQRLAQCALQRTRRVASGCSWRGCRTEVGGR